MGVLASIARRSLPLAAVAVVATTNAAHAAPTSFRTSGSCTHLSTAVPVDATAAQDLVGSGFVVLEPVPGTAVLALVVQDCETAVDDGRPTRGMANVAFVFVDPLRSPAGCETYDFFWTFSHKDDWYRAMQRIGLESGLAPASSLRVDPTVLAARASHPYRPAPFSITATALDAVAPPGPLPSVHCHAGPHGIVRQSYDHGFRAGGGVATFTLGPSALWDELGAANGTSAALLARFTWTGVTEIVPAD